MRIGKKILGIIGSLMCIGIFTSCTKTEVKGIDKIFVSMDYGYAGDPKWEEISLEELSSQKNEDSDKYGVAYIYIGFKANKGILINSITYTFNNTHNYNSESLQNSHLRWLNSEEGLETSFNNMAQNPKTQEINVDLNTSPITVEINTCVDTGVYFQCVISKGGEWSNISIDWREL